MKNQLLPKPIQKNILFWGGILVIIIAGIWGVMGISDSDTNLDLHTSPNYNSGSLHEFTWGEGGHTWTAGELSQTFLDVDGSGVNFTYTYSGNTNNFGNLFGLTPNVQDFFPSEEKDALSHYVFRGLGHSAPITLTIGFDPPIPGTLGFDLYHVNGSWYSGDKITVYAVPQDGEPNIYPTFADNGDPSWEDEGNGTIDAVKSSTYRNNAYSGVNFESADLIDKIVVSWTDCDLCGTGVHGFGMGNIEFYSLAAFPVEWGSIMVAWEAESSVLTWETLIESNTNEYHIERKVGQQQTFEVVGTVAAAGNSNELKNYQFIDESAGTVSKGEKVSYRIKQIDLDGKFEYSTLVELGPMGEKLSLKTFPNPATDFINIAFSGNTEGQLSLRVMSISGKVMHSSTVPSSQREPVKLSVNTWARGAYIIQLADDETMSSSKFVVE